MTLLKQFVAAIAVVVLVASAPACTLFTPPPTITTPVGQKAYQADQVVKRLGEVQQAVIDSQRANKIATADARAIVTWISGDAHATPPVEGAVDLLNAFPNGWKATLLEGWNAIARPKLLAAPDLAQYVPELDSLIAGVQ